jgi:hypothetical protein
MFLRFAFPLLLLAFAAPPASAQVVHFDGVLVKATPHHAPPVQAYLLLYVQDNVGVVVPVQTRTVVTLNGRRVTWRQLRPGDRVHVVYEGYARLVEARR